MALLIGVLIFNVSALPAAEPSMDGPTVIVVVGAAGTPEYGAQFAMWSGLWEKACSKAGAEFVTIGLDDGGESDDRTTLQKTLAGESNKRAAALWLVLIGHGTFDGRAAKFNLRGPDLSADDLAEWLQPITRPLAVIDAASSSAPFLNRLSAAGRVVITATKSGFEQNFTRFGQYLAESIAEPQADLDKDGQTSLLESFLAASNRSDEFYTASGRLATEHALLDDNGDGLGTRADWFRGVRPVQKAEGGASLDGYRAHQLHLVPSQAESQMPPQLRDKRDRLELEVIKLRDAKENYSEDEYYSKLEKLLCEIAQIYEEEVP
ncbi:MAG: hypothetical protein A2Z25_19650 [Planctomycetes bacterium RBG_16_55_9]|nr:MAG: hypothetical protein A2Z25_19650 [Planctomycetes bacterium RBG_16_55_9]